MAPSAALLATSAAAVAAGAALGALLRWVLAMWLNDASFGLAYFMPLGTLAANLIGGYAIGVAVGCFSAMPDVPPALRLFVITGVLGGLTTFSSFSAEVVKMLQSGRIGWAGLTIAAHLFGSLLMTVAGLASVSWWRGTA